MFNPEGGFMAGMGAFPSLTTKFMYENDDGKSRSAPLVKSRECPV